LDPGGQKLPAQNYRAADGERRTGGAIPNAAGRRADNLKVLVVDHNPLFRAGVQYLLNGVRGLKVVGEAGDSSTALEKMGTLKPDVVLIELSLKPLNGVEVTRRILAEKPDTSVIVVTTSRDAMHVAQAIDAGARGYLLKQSAAETLVSAIRTARHQMLTLDLEVGRDLRELLLQSPYLHNPGLNERERLLLGELCQGKSNRAIAETLGWPEQTVKNRLSALFRRLGVHTRAEAITYALEHKMMESSLFSSNGGSEPISVSARDAQSAAHV